MSNNICPYADPETDRVCTNVALPVPIPPPHPRNSAAPPAVPPPSLPNSVDGGTGSVDRDYHYHLADGRLLPGDNFSDEHAFSNQQRPPWPSRAMDCPYRDTPWPWPRAPSSRPVSARPRPKSAVSQKNRKCAIECAVSEVAAEVVSVGVYGCGTQFWEDGPTRVPSRGTTTSSSHNTPSKAREPDKGSLSLASRIFQIDEEIFHPRPHSAPPTSGGSNDILRCSRPERSNSAKTSSLERLRCEVSAWAQVPDQRPVSAPPQLWRTTQNQVLLDVGINNGPEGDCANFINASAHCERIERLTLAAESCGEKARGCVTDAIRHLLQKRNDATRRLKYPKGRHPQLQSAHHKSRKDPQLAMLADLPTVLETPNSSRLKSASGSWSQGKNSGSTQTRLAIESQHRVRDERPQKKCVQSLSSRLQRRQAALALKTYSDHDSKSEAFRVKKFHPIHSEDPKQPQQTKAHCLPAHARRRSEGPRPSQGNAGRSSLAGPNVRLSNFMAFRQSRLVAEMQENEDAQQAIETACKEFHTDLSRDSKKSFAESGASGSDDHSPETTRGEQMPQSNVKSPSGMKTIKVGFDNGEGGSQVMGRMKTAPAKVGHRRSHGLALHWHAAEPSLAGTSQREDMPLKQARAHRALRNTIQISQGNRWESRHVARRRNANRTVLPKSPSVQEHLKESGFQSSYLEITTEVKDLAHTRECAITDWQVYELARANDMKMYEVKLVKSFFDEQDTDDNGSLDYDEFEGAMSRLLYSQNSDIHPDAVRSACQKCWEDADISQDDRIDFKEFLEWFVDNRFTEDFLLKPEERKLRELARKYGITVQELEIIKRNFNSQDMDESGYIDSSEFKQVLYKILKVPCDVDLPQSRVDHFWREIDRDNSGSVSFEEFLAWWVERSSSLTPYEDYYWRIRPVGRDANYGTSAGKFERGVFGRGCGESGASGWFYG